MSEPTYHHTQEAPWFLLLFAAAITFFTLTWTTRGDPVLLIIFPLSGLMMAVFGFCFQHLTVADEADRLAIRCCPTGSATTSRRSPCRWNRTPATLPGFWPKSFDRMSTATTSMHLAVKVLSAGTDEVPGVYKDIEDVMREQADLVAVVARFNPRIVKMCSDGSQAED
jgi:hypothetical protein